MHAELSVHGVAIRIRGVVFADEVGESTVVVNKLTHEKHVVPGSWEIAFDEDGASI